MRTTQHLTSAAFVAAVLVGVVATSGSAQQTDGSNGSNGEPKLVLTALAWDIMPSEALALIEKGDQLAGSKKYGAARREYAAAAELIRAEGGFPSLPLEKTADTYYFQGMYRSAISTLDKLAREAAEVGDLTTQAWAQADAIWLFDIDCQSHAEERAARPQHGDEPARHESAPAPRLAVSASGDADLDHREALRRLPRQVNRSARVEV